MATPLKNVTTEELEKTIAEALKRYCPEGTELSVSVSDLQFDETLNRVDIKLSGWQRHTDNPYIVRT